MPKNQTGIQPKAEHLAADAVVRGHQMMPVVNAGGEGVKPQNKWLGGIGTGLQSASGMFNSPQEEDDEWRPVYSTADRYRRRLGLPQMSEY